MLMLTPLRLPIQAGFDSQLYLFLLASPLLLSIPVLVFGGWHSLSDHGHFDSPLTWLLGAAAAVPLLVLGRAIEGSRNEVFTSINWSTDLLALKLFGSRSQPIFAGLACAVMCIVVGVVEETAFRGMMLPASASLLETLGQSPQGATNLALVLTTAAFAVGHLTPSDYRRPLQAEVGVTLALQTIAGFWFAIIAVGTAPSAAAADSLGVAIIAHALYDFQVRAHPTDSLPIEPRLPRSSTHPNNRITRCKFCRRFTAHTSP
jgi:membrane protease YdiL (CAAX protease family)